ncbi:hypothetical protein [Paraburkholderia adhaesiva]|uniref:hypothetical protein n=1 Tax=Paraburkholderia adhaesiva TaxID=2883244 RepID=UPI001F1FE91D|nr:hypothetical protein [Paraburkholderia adhaesiva]
MQARRSISLLLASTVTALLGVSAYADDDPQASAAQTVATDSGATSTAPESVVTPKAPDTLAGVTTPATPATPDSDTATPASNTTAAAPPENNVFGVAMSPDQLDQQRGGDALVGQNFLTGDVANNVASRVQTGSNTITDGSFSGASGLPTVIQNTGANVLIQNATVLNVHFGN